MFKQQTASQTCSEHTQLCDFPLQRFLYAWGWLLEVRWWTRPHLGCVQSTDGNALVDVIKKIKKHLFSFSFLSLQWCMKSLLGYYTFPSKFISHCWPKDTPFHYPSYGSQIMMCGFNEQVPEKACRIFVSVTHRRQFRNIPGKSSRE